MEQPSKLIVIDHDRDGGALLVKNLALKFPSASIELVGESSVALARTGAERIDAVVLHRTEEEDAVSLIRMLRKLDASMPIIVVSGVDRSEQVLAAGATGFLNYDKWQLIGNFVANALMANARAELA